MLEAAHQHNLSPLVITYTNHPTFTLNPNISPFVLMPPEVRNAKLLNLGIRELEMLTFTLEMAQTTADDFLHNYLMPKYDPSIIVVGYDSRFGYKREGDLKFLQSHAPAYGYDLIHVEPELYDGKPISSSMIRSLLLSADIKQANMLLGEAFSLYGTVTHGRGAGRELGFPTANLKLDYPNQLVPATGIYLSKVLIAGAEFFGLTNIGYSPTLVHDGKLVIESFILDFDRDIYDQPMTVQLLDYLRAEKSFSSRDELINAMHTDLATARERIRSLI